MNASSSTYAIGLYLALVGGLYLLNGIGASIVGAMHSPTAAGIGYVFAALSLPFMLAAGGVIMHRTYGRYLAIALLGFDVVEKVLSVFVAGATFEVIWLALSLGAFGILVFANPYYATPRADLDEDRTAHSIGNLRR